MKSILALLAVIIASPTMAGSNLDPNGNQGSVLRYDAIMCLHVAIHEQGDHVSLMCTAVPDVRSVVRDLKSKLNDHVCDENFGAVSNAATLAKQFAKDHGLIYRGSCK